MTSPEESEQGGDQFFDAALLKSLLSFGLGAVRQRRTVALVVFGLVMIATILALIFLPRTYFTETKLIAQRNAVMAVRADSNWDSMRGVSETVLSHDNIVAMVRQTELVKNWRQRRPPLTRLKDWVAAIVKGEPTEEAQVQGMAWTVADHLQMSIGEGAISISIYWPEPFTAARLVEAAQQNFLEARHDAEIQSLVELVSIDETHSNELLDKVRIAAEQVKAARDQKLAQIDAARTPAPSAATSGSPPALVPRPPVTAHTRVPDTALAELKTQLADKKKKLKDLEDERRRKRLDAQNLLGELKGKFTEEYPEVRRQQGKVALLSEATTEEKSLATDIDDLEDELGHKGDTTAAAGALSRIDGFPPAAGGPTTDPIPPEVRRLLQETSDDRDPILGAQLRSVTNEYASLLDQTAKEKRELDRAQAAFKYRYRIVLPVETPSKPIKPKISSIVAAGLVAGFFLGVLAAVAAEIRAGRLRARWQVERLKLPVLADLKYPSIRGE